MKPPAAQNATKPARRANAGSPAPVAMPTRTVAARPMPSGIMKVIEATFSAIWCAASESAPNRPMTRVMVLNIIASKIIVMPIGSPSRNTSASLTPTGR